MKGDQIGKHVYPTAAHNLPSILPVTAAAARCLRTIVRQLNSKGLWETTGMKATDLRKRFKQNKLQVPLSIKNQHRLKVIADHRSAQSRRYGGNQQLSHSMPPLCTLLLIVVISQISAFFSKKENNCSVKHHTCNLKLPPPPKSPSPLCTTCPNFAFRFAQDSPSANSRRSTDARLHPADTFSKENNLRYGAGTIKLKKYMYIYLHKCILLPCLHTFAPAHHLNF